ncbi:MAG: MFS transporter [Promethearchaeota archaeon]
MIIVNNKAKSNKGGISKRESNLSRKEQFLYSIVFFPNIILAGIFSLNYVNFFWDNLKLQQLYFSIGLLIYTIVNPLNDFYLGRLTDKTNVARWGGRRLIYMKWGGPLWAFLFFSMWFPWSYTNQVVIFIHFITSIIGFDMMLSLVWMVWTAVLPEMTENIEERNVIMLYSYFMSLLGAFPVMIAFLLFETSLVWFQAFAGVCAVICGVLYYIVGANLKERPELYKQQEIIPLKQAIKEMFRLKSFVADTIYRSFNQINIILSSSFIFAYLFILGVDLLTASLLFTFNSIILGFLGNYIYTKLSMTRDMRDLIIRGKIGIILINLTAFFIILFTGYKILIWIFLLIGTIIGGYGLFDYPLLMLVTDDDEVMNGTRREGTIIGTNVFFIKITESLAPILGTSILLFFGYVQGASIQSPRAELGILFLMTVVPSIIHFFALLGILYFPLHGDYLKEMNEKLLKIHEEKVKLFSSSSK